MTKLYLSQAKYLQFLIYQDYNLKIKIETAQGIVKAMINQDVQQSYDALRFVHGDIAFRMFEAYFATTKMPEEERNKHSAYWFAHYIRRHYWVFAIPKAYWLLRSHKKINKIINKYALTPINRRRNKGLKRRNASAASHSSLQE